MLGIDSLEDRLLLTAQLDPTSHLTQIAEVSSPDPYTIPAYAGPGDNTVVSISNPSPTVTTPNPSNIPASAGPTDNTVVTTHSVGEAQPNPYSIPVYAGPGENTVVSNTPPATSQGIYSVLPIGQLPQKALSLPLNLPPTSAVPVETASFITLGRGTGGLEYHRTKPNRDGNSSSE